jgi:hypothetical protein
MRPLARRAREKQNAEKNKMTGSESGMERGHAQILELLPLSEKSKCRDTISGKEKTRSTSLIRMFQQAHENGI